MQTLNTNCHPRPDRGSICIDSRFRGNDKGGGFTLIELMIVTTIITIIGGASIVAINRFAERREALTDALALAEHLRKIQVKASAVDVPTGCGGIQSYTVKMSGASLTVDINCTSGSVTNAADLRLSLANSVFLSVSNIVFDSRTVSATETNIEICGNSYKFGVSVSKLANISQPSYLGACP